MTTPLPIIKNATHSPKPPILNMGLKAISDSLARIALDKDLGFYSFISNGLLLTAEEGLGTVATDMKHLFFDPVKVLEWPHLELTAVLLHEIIHCVFAHPSPLDKARMGSRKIDIWRIAQEFVVNGEVYAIQQNSIRYGMATYKLPGKPIGVADLSKAVSKNISLVGIHYFDPRFNGKSTEEVYDILSHEVDWSKSCLDSAMSGKILDKPSENSPKQNGENQHASSQACSCIVPQDSGADTSETIERVLAAAEIYGGTGYGNLPAGIAREVRRLKQAKVPWQRVLANRIGQVLNNDELSYSRGNYRHGIVEDYVLPGQWGVQPGDVVFAFDTSGSITKSFLEQSVSEVANAMMIVEESVVMSSDCLVHERVVARNVRDLLTSIKFKGGGGTDFCPVFDAISESKMQPSLLVYFTDGEGSYPEEKPGYDVLWVMPESSDHPPFGQRAVIVGY